MNEIVIFNLINYRDKTMSQGEIINFCEGAKKLPEKIFMFHRNKSLIKQQHNVFY